MSTQTQQDAKDFASALTVLFCVILTAFAFYAGTYAEDNKIFFEACLHACEHRDEEFKLQEDNMCICEDTTLTSDLPRMWKEHK
jgi:hypothetical protein